MEAAAELPRLGGITRPEDANTAALSDRLARMWLSVLSLRRTQLRIVRTVGQTRRRYFLRYLLHQLCVKRL